MIWVLLFYLSYSKKSLLKHICNEFQLSLQIQFLFSSKSNQKYLIENLLFCLFANIFYSYEECHMILCQK